MLKNIKQCSEIWCCFAGFDSSYGLLWNTTHCSKLSLAKSKRSTLLHHGTYDRGNIFNFIDVFSYLHFHNRGLYDFSIHRLHSMERFLCGAYIHLTIFLHSQIFKSYEITWNREGLHLH